VENPLPAAGRPLETLEDIYRLHFGYVWHALRRLGVHASDLEDVTQEVFVVVHKRLSTFDRERPLKPWLFGVLYRVASDQRRKAYHAREVQGDHVATDPMPGPEERAQARQEQDLVARALDTLDFEKRAVLVMHTFHDHPVVDIAAALQIPVNTAYSRLRLARAQFAAAVKSARQQGGAP
jgi:RNA polymerase sigma-70 factor (ECF subfamily)